MQKRFFPKSELDLNSVLSDLNNYFKLVSHDVQIISLARSTVLQAKKESTITNVSGLSSALTVQFTHELAGYWVEVGVGKWLEKAAVGIVGYALFWPLMITSALGLYNTHRLSEEMWRIIGANVARKRCSYDPPSETSG